MQKRIKRKRRRKLSTKEQKMLNGSEWILLGILFVGVTDFFVKQYDLKWSYLPYAFAVFGVLGIRLLIRFTAMLTKGANAFLNHIKDL
jgi:hypothetical protein